MRQGIRSRIKSIELPPSQLEAYSVGSSMRVSPRVSVEQGLPMVTCHLGALEWSAVVLCPGFPFGSFSSPRDGSDPTLHISCGGLIPRVSVS